MTQPKPEATANDLVDAIEKLCRHIDALRLDTARLSGRIIPVEGEQAPLITDEWFSSIQRNIADHKARGKISIDTILGLVVSIDHRLQNAERDFSYIRGQVEAIANDAFLQSDWKHWMTRPPGEVSR